MERWGFYTWMSLGFLAEWDRSLWESWHCIWPQAENKLNIGSMLINVDCVFLAGVRESLSNDVYVCELQGFECSVCGIGDMFKGRFFVPVITPKRNWVHVICIRKLTRYKDGNGTVTLHNSSEAPPLTRRGKVDSQEIARWTLRQFDQFLGHFDIDSMSYWHWHDPRSF